MILNEFMPKLEILFCMWYSMCAHSTEEKAYWSYTPWQADVGSCKIKHLLYNHKKMKPMVDCQFNKNPHQLIDYNGYLTEAIIQDVYAFLCFPFLSFAFLCFAFITYYKPKVMRGDDKQKMECWS